MSLLGTLAKVALGVAVAKGVSGMMKKGSAPAGQQGQAGQQGGGGLGDLLGGALGGGNTQGNAGGGGLAGGLGGLLEQLGGNQARGQSGGGGLGGLLGGLAGAAGGAAGKGGLGDLLGGLAGNAPQERSSGGTFGELLNGSLQNGGEPEVQPSADEEAAAGLMLSAMIQAAKADGTLDDDERQRLMENLEDASQEEMDFVNREFQAPVDINRLVSQVPNGMQQQVYAMSVMGIKLDDQSEAEYLHKLASAMNISQADVNGIHDQMGAPRIYS